MLEVDDATLWRLLLTLLMVPDPRNKLPQYNTVDQAVKLISDARNIMVLTGAGVRTLRILLGFKPSPSFFIGILGFPKHDFEGAHQDGPC